MIGEEKRILATLRKGDFLGEFPSPFRETPAAWVRALRAAEPVRQDQKDSERPPARPPQTWKAREQSLQTRLENKLRLPGIFRDRPAKEGMI